MKFGDYLPSQQLLSTFIVFQVRDRGNKKRLSSTGMLKLNVLDINDNPPIFDHNQVKKCPSKSTTLVTALMGCIQLKP